MLAAARSSFGKKGYAQTSVEEIADAARVTKGAVYHHFAGKEALFRAVLAEVEAEAEARADREAGDLKGPPIDQIVAGVDAYLDGRARRGDPADHADRRAGRARARAGRPRRPAAGPRGLRSFIATSIARGQIIDLDPDVLAHLVGGLACWADC